MGKLFQTILRLIDDDKYVVGLHASERLDERHIMEWQVVDGMRECTLVAERPDATPNPTIETLVTLADGVTVKAVWSHLRLSGVAKLITVHYVDRT